MLLFQSFGTALGKKLQWQRSIIELQPFIPNLLQIHEKNILFSSTCSAVKPYYIRLKETRRLGQEFVCAMQTSNEMRIVKQSYVLILLIRSEGAKECRSTIIYYSRNGYGIDIQWCFGYSGGSLPVRRSANLKNSICYASSAVISDIQSGALLAYQSPSLWYRPHREGVEGLFYCVRRNCTDCISSLRCFSSPCYVSLVFLSETLSSGRKLLVAHLDQ